MIVGHLAGTPFPTDVRAPRHQRALPCPAAHPEVITARPGGRAALIRAATPVVEHLYAPAGADERLAALGMQGERRSRPVAVPARPRGSGY
ncbi:hypothetical protein [Streptomyces sp. NPDC058308]|uniref:hypothetical protein n=1 Tax=Streptomyces sp. NPDC058308 TaxID=3346440 RepID=UPI0036E15537